MVPVRNSGQDGEPAPAVECVGVDLGHDRTLALTGVDLRLSAGHRVALIGPNGSGKTTLLHAVAGLIPARAGRILVLGERPGRLRAEVAYVVQAARVGRSLPVTVQEVVRMGHHPRRGLVGRLSSDDKAAVTVALQRLDLVDVRHRHLGELSGGQRQRVMVAQALVQRARLLLLDEPLTGLDLPSQAIIEDVLTEELDRGVTVVVSTHDLSETSGADCVVLLAGRVVATGSPEDVLVADRLAEAYGGRLTRLRDGSMILDDGSHHH